MQTTTARNSRPNAAQRRAEAKLRHALALNRAFPLNPGDPIFSTYRALRLIEMAEHRRAERVCNGEINETDEQAEAHEKKVLAKVRAILGIDEKRAQELGLFINGDPRGYALKLDDDKARDFIRTHELTRDMGGYGILAPDFSGR